MKLIKFCRPEHNVRNGFDLKLGSLFDFRATENSEIRDEDEGVYEFSFDFIEPVIISVDLANLLFYGQIEFGPSRFLGNLPINLDVQIDRLAYAHIGEDLIRMRDAKILIRIKTNNCLVFCMSLAEHDFASPFPGYTDSWKIETNQAQVFANGLAKSLARSHLLDELSDDFAGVDERFLIRNLSIRSLHKPIEYRDRVTLISQENIPKFEDVMKLFLTVPFVKPTKFQHEQEYRFIFEMVDAKRYYRPKRISYFLPIEIID